MGVFFICLIYFLKIKEMADPTATLLSERVKSTVNQKLLPSVADGIFSGNVLLYRLMSNPQPWSGGVMMARPFMWKKSNQGGSFSVGETFDSAAEDLTVRLAFDPKFVEQPVTIWGTELSLNQGEAGVIQLVATQMEMARIRLADRLADMMYGDGTGNTSKDMLGLQAIVDDGTNATTYGGQTRSALGTTLNASLVTSVGNLTLAHMATQVDNARGTGGMATEPTLIVCPKAVYSYYEALLTPTVRSQMDLTGPMRVYSQGPATRVFDGGANQGFPSLAFRGLPVVADDKCTSGNMYFLNENEIAFYNVQNPKLQSFNKEMSTIKGSTYNNAPTTLPVQWRGWIMTPTQYGETGQFIIGGQLISWNPRRHARSTGITGS